MAEYTKDNFLLLLCCLVIVSQSFSKQYFLFMSQDFSMASHSLYISITVKGQSVHKKE